MKDSVYFVSPPAGPGPAVLLLHSWWGLDSKTRLLADRISDDGFTVLVPDLVAGETFDVAEAAEVHLASLDPNRIASLTAMSVGLAREKGVDPLEPISVIGLSMGASLGLWASIRMPEAIDRVVAFYGSQSLDFTPARASYLLHFAQDDEIIDSDEAAFMEATIELEGRPVESFTYPRAAHWFAEPGRPNYDERQAATAWDRTVQFLHRS